MKFGLTYAKRLLKLAGHLEGGSLYHSKFRLDANSKQIPCGTVGCALGEADGIFGRGLYCDKNDLTNSLLRGPNALAFFGLTNMELVRLFFPSDSDEYMLFRGALPKDSTQYQVALHIRTFVASKLGVVRPKPKRTEPCFACDGTGKVEITADRPLVVAQVVGEVARA